jgi:hypothetical protein
LPSYSKKQFADFAKRHKELKKTLEEEGVDKLDPLWSLHYYIGLVKDEFCHYCSVFGLNMHGHCLDRMDNKKSHIAANVVMCCTSCNMYKGSRLTYEAMIYLRPALKSLSALRKQYQDEKKALEELEEKKPMQKVMRSKLLSLRQQQGLAPDPSDPTLPEVQKTEFEYNPGVKIRIENRHTGKNYFI